MSRSALWRQEDKVKARAAHAQDVFARAVEEGRQNSHLRGIIPLSCSDDTFNMHPMLLQNIAKSPYFHKCVDTLTDWNGLVDEIYYEVKHLEPFTAGAQKSPSTAFCLLLRLFTLRCTEKQMHLMLEHVDSPYIRCIGFLYLRYAAEPSTLWTWFEPYLHDDEPVQVRQGRADTTVGEFVRSLLEDMDYHGTRLPRLPLTIERQVKVKLLQSERIEERAKQHMENKAAMEYFQKIGARVQALYGDADNPVTWYDAVVDRAILRDLESGELLERPKFYVTFPEYGNTEIVTLGEVDLPGSNDLKRSPVESGGSKMDCGRGHDDGGRTFEREHRRRDDRYRGRSYDDDRHRRGGGRYDRSPPRRERSRSRDRGDNLNDARREEKELMDLVLKREREKTEAKGRAYATSRPSAFRGESRIEESRHGAHGSDWKPPPKPKAPRREEKHTKSPPPEPKTAAELAAIEEKKRKLMARYG